jgi:hypothetical protein
MTDAKENEDMVAKMIESGWADIAYEDDEARFLKIREIKGEAPKEALDETPPTPEELKELEEMEKNDNTVNSNSPVNDDEP